MEDSYFLERGGGTKNTKKKNPKEQNPFILPFVSISAGSLTHIPDIPANTLIWAFYKAQPSVFSAPRLFLNLGLKSTSIFENISLCKQEHSIVLIKRHSDWPLPSSTYTSEKENGILNRINYMYNNEAKNAKVMVSCK